MDGICIERKPSAWEKTRSCCLEVGQGKVPLGTVRGLNMLRRKILVVEECFSENLTSEV